MKYCSNNYSTYLFQKITITLEQVDEDVELPDEAVLETESTVELRLVKALLMEVACWVV